MNAENWKWIPGYENRYEVSDQGRIKSYVKKGGGSKILTPDIVREYPVYRIFRADKKVSRHAVHRLVLLAFAGPSNGRVACHINDIKSDNNLKNLRWGTAEDNCADAKRNGRIALGEAHNQSKLLLSEVIIILKSLKAGVTQKKLAERFKVSQTTIYKINANKRWSVARDALKEKE